LRIAVSILLGLNPRREPWGVSPLTRLAYTRCRPGVDTPGSPRPAPARLVRSGATGTEGALHAGPVKIAASKFASSDFGRLRARPLFLHVNFQVSAQRLLSSTGLLHSISNRKPACKVGVGGHRFLNQCSMNRELDSFNGSVCDAPPCGDA